MMDGELVPFAAACVHVLTPAVKFAGIVFEGIRGYWSPDLCQLFVFRLGDHLSRLDRSAKANRMSATKGRSELEQDVITLLRANNWREDVHIRVQLLLSEVGGGMASTGPTSMVISALPMRQYFARDELDVAISSWSRISEISMPPRIKAVPNYHNSRLALIQAKLDGYDDTILLSPNGKVAEGPAYNIFMVRGGQLATPPVTDNILEGITRETLLTLASETLGIEVRERSIDRTELYSAAELFFCGSGAEVTPIRSVDRHIVGDACPGPITTALREAYFSVARGGVPDRHGWLSAVYEPPSGAARDLETVARHDP
jgi:branched-chain amino acid aminotransferase